MIRAAGRFSSTNKCPCLVLFKTCHDSFLTQLSCNTFNSCVVDVEPSKAFGRKNSGHVLPAFLNQREIAVWKEACCIRLVFLSELYIVWTADHMHWSDTKILCNVNYCNKKNVFRNWWSIKCSIIIKPNGDLIVILTFSQTSSWHVDGMSLCIIHADHVESRFSYELIK